MSRYIWQHADWPRFTWSDSRIIDLLSRCNYERGLLLGRIRALGMANCREARFDIMTSEVLQTSAIEGQTLSPESVRSSIALRLGLPDAGLARPTRDAQGLVDVLLDATENFDRPLSIERLHGWQAALFPTGYSGLHRIITGNFRDESPMQVVSGPIGRERVHYQAPPGDRVPHEIASFLKWWHARRNAIDGLLRAAVAGFWFVTIHPYADGNGRIARALTDMALAQDENLAERYYSLSTQIMDDRQSYYQALEKCQKGDLDITAWVAWFLECFQRAIHRADGIVGRVLQKSRFWQLHRDVALTQRQRKVINRLLDAGPGGFEGGLTTRKYTGMTRASRATSYREIADLVNKGLLRKNPGMGRSSSYDLVWGG